MYLLFVKVQVRVKGQKSKGIGSILASAFQPHKGKKDKERGKEGQNMAVLAYRG
jgi:hypothetical protein